MKLFFRAYRLRRGVQFITNSCFISFITTLSLNLLLAFVTNFEYFFNKYCL